MTDDRLYGERWRVLREIGKGGQGIAFEVEDISSPPSKGVTVSQFAEVIRNATVTVQHDGSNVAVEQLMELIRGISSRPALRKGALKKLLPVGNDVNATTAMARMKSELAAMRAIDHSSLIKVLDEKVESGWYVTEYYSGGTLGDRLEQFKGHVLDSLLAFRPVVEAVAELHGAGVVHRDIKPDNIFVDSKDRLVLGDCGLAFKMEGVDRITETFENVGSRDWMPGWAMGMRLGDVRPNFDVFSLGKLLWSMISGDRVLQLWYHRRPQFDLAQRFQDDESIAFAQAILDQTVVENPENCLVDASKLLALVDWTIGALRMRIRIVNGTLIRGCQVCGQGNYSKIVDHDVDRQRNFGLNVVSQPKFQIYVCDGCGHSQLFYSMDGLLPEVWRKNS